MTSGYTSNGSTGASLPDPGLDAAGLPLAEIILQGLEAGVAAVDEDGRVLMINPAGAGIFGLEPQDCLGRDLLSLVPQDRARQPSDALEGGHFRMEFRHERRDGRAVEVGATYRPLPPAGSPLRGVYLFKDVGQDRRRAQLEERDRQYAYMDELATAFAHELRNPLASIQAISHLVKVEKSLESLPDYGDRLERLVMRIENLVKDLLAFGRPSKPRPERVPAERLVQDGLALLDARLKPGAPGPAVTFARPDLAVLVDATQAAQALAALVENALDSVGDPARVSLLVAVTQNAAGEGRVAFTVRDDGPGIQPGILPKIFRPFFSTKPRGAGFGLAIALRLAEDNQGLLQVESEPWVETRFTLSLPRA